MSEPRTVAGLLGAALGVLGVERIFGAPTGGVVGIEGMAHVRVDDPVLAHVLAGAAGRLGPAPGAALLEGRRLWLGAVPGWRPTAITVDDPADLVELVATWDRNPLGAALELDLALDLDAPVPDGVAPLRVDAGNAGMALAPELRDVDLVVVAGAGVAREGRGEDLAAFARLGSVPVALAPGAAGLLAGDDPWCAGVVGVQADDAVLAGVAGAGLVVVTGVDGVEFGPDGATWGGVPVLEASPAHLATLGLRWPPPERPPPSDRPLVDAVTRVVAELDPAGPTPRTACEALGVVARRGTVVAADAGPAGLWLSRVGTAAEPGSLRLPGLRSPGFAVASAMAAALAGSRAVAVVTAPVDPVTAELLDLAAAWQLDLVVVTWGAADAGGGSGGGSGGGDVGERWRAALRSGLRTPGVVEVPFDVDGAATRLLVEALGPVEGWAPGPEPGPARPLDPG